MTTRAQVFVCKSCKRETPAHRGCDDDLPDHCDDCWLEAHPELALSVVTAEHHGRPES